VAVRLRIVEAAGCLGLGAMESRAGGGRQVARRDAAARLQPPGVRLQLASRGGRGNWEGLKEGPRKARRTG
jgi:hypothetical protein